MKLRIQRWLEGDLSAPWSEAVAGGWSLSKHLQSSSQQKINIRRAKLAVQDGQYSKAIKALTSEGLASPSAAVLQEMLNPCLLVLCLLPLFQSLLTLWGFGLFPMDLLLVRLACDLATFGKLFSAPLLIKLTKL